MRRKKVLAAQKSGKKFPPQSFYSFVLKANSSEKCGLALVLGISKKKNDIVCFDICDRQTCGLIFLKKRNICENVFTSLFSVLSI